MNGARNAFAGFLYQMIVDVGFTLLTFENNVRPEGPEIDVIVGLVAKGFIEQERYHEDAIVRHLGLENLEGIALIQYKHSSLTTPPPITESELLDIVNHLGRGWKSAEAAGERVTNFILISNRALGPSAQNLLDKAKRGEFDSHIGERECQILPSILVPTATDLGLETWMARIRLVGERFGLSEDELKRGFNEVLGHCLGQLGAGKMSTVERPEVLQMMVGSRTATPLVPEFVKLVTRAVAKQFLDELEIQLMIRRSVLDQISEAVIDNAMVALVGRGGCGKSVALAQWSMNQVSIEPADQNAFTHIAHSSSVMTDSWLADVISLWMNIRPTATQHQRDTPEQLIDRIIRANPKISHPVAFLALDGIDECRDTTFRAVNTICEFFFRLQKASRLHQKSPPANLIVTCRTKEDLNMFLPTSVTGRYDPWEKLKIIEIPEFSDEELVQLCNDRTPALGDTLQKHMTRKRRIFTLNDPLSVLNDEMTVLSAPPIHSSSPAGVTDIIDCLMHPIMAEAFVREADPNRVLSGDSKALHSLAEQFVSRFIRKVRLRLTYPPVLDDSLKRVLICIAQESSGHKTSRFSQKEWVQAACKENILTERSSRDLYTQSISAGVIMEESGQWFWRHFFVREYLSTLGLPK